MSDGIEKLPPFDTLPAPVLTDLKAASSEVTKDADEVVFEQGDGSDRVYVVLDGRVRIAHHKADGTILTQCIISGGETFCCLPALDGGPYPATAAAMSESRLLEIPGVVFRDLVDHNPAFGRAALMQFCGRLRENGCEGCGVSDDAQTRIASRTLQMLDKLGNPVPLTRREVAELAGTTVETAIRILKSFERAGILALARGSMKVIDRDTLEQMAKDTPVPISLKGSPDSTKNSG